MYAVANSAIMVYRRAGIDDAGLTDLCSDVNNGAGYDNRAPPNPGARADC